jgi:hypothetical protein
MGQDLAIGLVTVASISKSELEKGKISQQELIAEMEKQLLFAPALYEALETESQLRYVLRQEIFEAQLLPLLEEMYPHLYGERRRDTYERVLQMLRETVPAEWMAAADAKGSEAYQEDHYGEQDYLYFDKPFRPYVSIGYRSIILSVEGKTYMEIRGRQFRFFKHCMTQTFGSHPLAGALRVYITG